MKKIGIITLYYKNLNFGGLLQAYALPQAIENYFHIECEQITYNSQRNIPVQSFWRTFQTTDKRTVSGMKKIIKKAGEAALNTVYSKRLLFRKQKFLAFADTILHSQTVYTDETLHESNHYYSAVICGGDQIWNDWGNWLTEQAVENFSLQFVKSDLRKISYAPSMGGNQMSTEFCNRIQPGLAKLNFVSVREKESVDIVKKMSGKPVTVVLDPVLLLTKNDWDKVQKTVNAGEKKYVLGYFLGTDRQHRWATQKFAETIHAKTHVFPFIYGNRVNRADLFFGDMKDFTSGPAEFVGLIKNAACVITDSFHAMVFSLIYHKPFYVFERNTQVGGGTMNSRIYDFLEEFGLKDRLVTPEELKGKRAIEPIDYSYADEVLARRRQESFNYLKQALEINDEK